MKPAISSRLPRDTVIDFAGVLNKPPRLYIGMTITTLDQVEALREAIDIFRQVLEIGGAGEFPTPNAETVAALKDAEAGRTEPVENHADLIDQQLGSGSVE